MRKLKSFGTLSMLMKQNLSTINLTDFYKHDTESISGGQVGSGSRVGSNRLN
jgi:hypothetical protein